MWDVATLRSQAFSGFEFFLLSSRVHACALSAGGQHLIQHEKKYVLNYFEEAKK